MPCRKPLEAVQPHDGGKPVVYSHGRRPKTLAEGYKFLELPCGQCTGCRLEKSRQWGIRIACEAAYWWEFHLQDSVFITLTYEEKYLPDMGTLVKEHLQKFIKRLRERIRPIQLRYYAAGEYGTTCVKHNIQNCPECGRIQRPHYHAIILGYGFPDKYHIGNREGEPVYESELLEQTWPYGFHEIGSCSFQSAAYVARYIMKKQTGPAADEAYQRYCWMRDKFYNVEPEFAFMSKNPGIGMPWVGVWHQDLYPTDEMPIPGRGTYGIPPKYFDKLIQKWDLYDLEAIKQQRRTNFAESLVTGPSLESRAIVQNAKMSMLGRNI